jgi:hypothetical protein
MDEHEQYVPSLAVVFLNAVFEWNDLTVLLFFK